MCVLILLLFCFVCGFCFVLFFVVGVCLVLGGFLLLFLFFSFFFFEGIVWCVAFWKVCVCVRVCVLGGGGY